MSKILAKTVLTAMLATSIFGGKVYDVPKPPVKIETVKRIECGPKFEVINNFEKELNIKRSTHLGIDTLLQDLYDLFMDESTPNLRFYDGSLCERNSKQFVPHKVYVYADSSYLDLCEDMQNGLKVGDWNKFYSKINEISGFNKSIITQKGYCEALTQILFNKMEDIYFNHKNVLEKTKAEFRFILLGFEENNFGLTTLRNKGYDEDKVLDELEKNFKGDLTLFITLKGLYDNTTKEKEENDGITRFYQGVIGTSFYESDSMQAVYVLAHEIGHVFKLNHTNNKQSIMYGEGDYPTKVEITKTEIEGLVRYSSLRKNKIKSCSF